MDILTVGNLRKSYPGFELKNVTFSLEEGYIMGFIGRNGAGKTTTLKSILNLVHPEGGQVMMGGLDFKDNELDCKQLLGWVSGAADYYPKKKLGTVVAVVRRFYENWDDWVFSGYLKRFKLDPNKKIDELSNGMRVKFALALALSHRARLFILDEPTSGLDPVSRDDLLEVFQSLVEDGERSVLFSTHIISDLEKCADLITYIKDGAVIASTELPEFVNAYRLVRGTERQLSSDALKNRIIGVRKYAYGMEGLIKTDDIPSGCEAQIMPADLESIMIHIEKE